MYLNEARSFSGLGETPAEEKARKAWEAAMTAKLIAEQRKGKTAEQIAAEEKAGKEQAERTRAQTFAQYNRFMVLVKQAATPENLFAAEGLYAQLHMYGRPAIYGPTLMAAVEKNMKEFRDLVAKARAAPTAVTLPSELSTLKKNWAEYIFRTPKFENYDYLSVLYNDMTTKYARYFSADELKKTANQLATFYNALPKEIKTVPSVTGDAVRAGGPPQVVGKPAAVIYQEETGLINKMLDDFNAYLKSLPLTANKHAAMLAIYNELKSKYAKHFLAWQLPEMATKLANYYAKLTAPAAPTPEVKPIVITPPAAAAITPTFVQANGTVTQAVAPATGYAYTLPAPAAAQPIAVSETPVETAVAAAAAISEEGITLLGMKIPYKFIYLAGAAVAFWMFSQQMTSRGRR